MPLDCTIEAISSSELSYPLPGEVVVPLEIGQPVRGSGATFEDEGNELILFWLRLLANMTCAQANATMLGCLATYPVPPPLRFMCPTGPHMISQSTLMHLYQHYISLSTANSYSGSPSSQPIVDALKSVVTTLNQRIEQEMGRGTGNSKQHVFYLHSLSDAVATLQSLIASLQPVQPYIKSPSNRAQGQEHGQEDNNRSPDVVEAPMLGGLDSVMPDSLNYIYPEDWAGLDGGLFWSPGP
ncbi:hypothetical protein GQ53DRAFT_761897 [Thozetella sp. PMI_491]|nr:hypothetical protein GQ53DRAFT_761897 [Thozetella sp. PMI_491]